MANVSEFLDAYFGGLKSREQTRQFNAEQARLAAQQQAELQQRQAEMKQRQDQWSAQQEFEKAKYNYQKQQNEQDRIDKFTLAGGIAQEAPHDKPLDYTTGGQQPAPAMDLSFLGVQQPNAGGRAPVGAPAVPQGPMPVTPGNGAQPQYGMNQEAIGQDIVQGLPRMATPAIPMQGVETAQAQMPDPAHFQQVPNLLGGDSTKQYFAPTPLEQARQRKAADNEANTMETPEWMAKAVPELGLKPGQTMDRRDLPFVEKALEFKQAQAQKEAQFAETAADRRKAESDSMFMKALMLQLQQEKAEKKGIDDTVKSAFMDSVLSNPQSFHAINDNKLKESIITDLSKQGLSIPNKVPQSLETQQGAARTAIEMVKKVRDMIHDPDLQKYYGAASGRAMLLGIGTIGNLGNVPPEVQQKLADLHYMFNILKLIDAKQAMPGRLIGSLVEQMGKTTARFDESLPLIEGSLRGTIDNSRAALVGIQQYVGKGWAERPEFTKTLPNNLVERNDVPADVAAKLPLNSVRERNGMRLLRKMAPPTLDKDGNEIPSNQIKVYEVKD